MSKSDDDLTKPLIKKVMFNPNVDVRDSLTTDDGVISYHQTPYALDGPKTDSVSKIAGITGITGIGTTRFGFSKSTKSIDKDVAANIADAEKKMSEEDAELTLQKMRDKAHKLKYGECDDEKPCCGDKCTILGGKKTKRRRYTRKYTKKHRSRKSRRSKKGSKNNKK